MAICAKVLHCEQHAIEVLFFRPLMLVLRRLRAGLAVVMAIIEIVQLFTSLCHMLLDASPALVHVYRLRLLEPLVMLDAAVGACDSMAGRHPRATRSGREFRCEMCIVGWLLQQQLDVCFVALTPALFYWTMQQPC